MGGATGDNLEASGKKMSKTAWASTSGQMAGCTGVSIKTTKRMATESTLGRTSAHILATGAKINSMDLEFLQLLANPPSLAFGRRESDAYGGSRSSKKRS